MMYPARMAGAGERSEFCVEIESEPGQELVEDKK